MVDFDSFVRWAESRFGDVRVRGSEVHLNSIFDPDGDDAKHKLACRPGGDTKKGTREDGVYHCWLSDKGGTLVSLVMHVDQCSPEEARDQIGAGSDIASLEEQMREIFGGKKPDLTPETPAPSLELPPDTHPITGLSSWNRHRVRAEAYLRGRKIPPDGLYFCTGGDFRDRVIIPYIDKKGSLVYFNGRHIVGGDKVVKYLGPPKEWGVGKGDVVYCPSYPNPGEKLYVTEGEFDALTLHLCGFPAASVGGANLSVRQARILRDYRPVLSVDNDDAGRRALLRISQVLRDNGVTRFGYVRPPVGYKDWNSLYQKRDAAPLAAYLRRCEKAFSEEEEIRVLGESV